jgi:hypothetical protein
MTNACPPHLRSASVAAKRKMAIREFSQAVIVEHHRH